MSRSQRVSRPLLWRMLKRVAVVGGVYDGVRESFFIISINNSKTAKV